MKDSLEDAFNEVKRCDHLIHVSLKYTRTVDVLISVLKRFISCIDFSMNSLLLKSIEEKNIENIPESPLGKLNMIKKLYDDQIIQDIMEKYGLFRRLVRADYSKRNEYRRYVTMTVDDNGTIVEIDIDKVSEYFIEIKKYLIRVQEIIE